MPLNVPPINYCINTIHIINYQRDLRLFLATLLHTPAITPKNILLTPHTQIHEPIHDDFRKYQFFMRHAWMELSPDNNTPLLHFPLPIYRNVTETIDYKHIAGFGAFNG